MTDLELALHNKGWVLLAGEWVHPSRAKELRAQKPKLVARVPLVEPDKREEKGRVRFAITFTVYSCRPCDWDNYYTKPLQDCLRAAGYFPDDDWQTLEGRVITKKAQCKAEERTEIDIKTL